MTTQSLLSLALAALAGLLLCVGTEGHGYLQSPKSRNYVAWENGQEYCPHCLNLGGTLGECGVTGSSNYDLIPSGPQGTYSKGAIVEFDLLLTAHHKGHFEFHACPISPGQIPSASCFAQYPLEFVSDELYGATKDPDYPGRAYIAPIDYSGLQTASSIAGSSGTFYRFRFKLPDDLVGDLVLIQWHYLTANSCQYDGYSTYAFPSGWNMQPSSMSICNPSPDGSGVPEQFWNCAEVSIVDGPTSAATSAPLPAPVDPVPTSGYPVAPTPAPMIAPTPAPVVVTRAPVDPTRTPVATPTRAPVVKPTRSPVASPPTDSSEWTLSTVTHRCGRGSYPEVDARGNCRAECTHSEECGAGESCVGVHENYCGSKPTLTCEYYENPSTINRCGTSEIDAREKCGAPCSSTTDCGVEEWCWTVHPNFCECSNDYRRKLRGGNHA